MIYVGVDPDLHCLSIAKWYDGAPIEAYVLRVPKNVTGDDAVDQMIEQISKVNPPGGLRSMWAIEGQELARTGSRQHKRPQDIVRLAQVAGAMAGAVQAREGTAIVVLVPPSEWKGSVPKAVMQARLYEDLGWGYEMVGKGKPADYARPLRPSPAFDNIRGADWKHVGDAILLARWASEQL